MKELQETLAKIEQKQTLQEKAILSYIQKIQELSIDHISVSFTRRSPHLPLLVHTLKAHP
ncbi:MAG: hypothetical protein H7A42_07545 [Chlamydiales bacterium]|nr:hypothetical protein [Chlamydiales bacterium]